MRLLLRGCHRQRMVYGLVSLHFIRSGPKETKHYLAFIPLPASPSPRRDVRLVPVGGVLMSSFNGQNGHLPSLFWRIIHHHPSSFIRQQHPLPPFRIHKWGPSHHRLGRRGSTCVGSVESCQTEIHDSRALRGDIGNTTLERRRRVDHWFSRWDITSMDIGRSVDSLRLHMRCCDSEADV